MARVVAFSLDFVHRPCSDLCPLDSEIRRFGVPGSVGAACLVARIGLRNASIPLRGRLVAPPLASRIRLLVSRDSCVSGAPPYFYIDVWFFLSELFDMLSGLESVHLAWP